MNKKHHYIIVYGYGMGSVWGIMKARSREEIVAKYPMLEVADERPDWMTDKYYNQLISNVLDIDVEPTGWLAAAIEAEK